MIIGIEMIETVFASCFVWLWTWVCHIKWRKKDSGLLKWPFFGHCPSIKFRCITVFRKPAMLPSSGAEKQPNLVDPLERSGLVRLAAYVS
jgi:hypothetical protein